MGKKISIPWNSYLNRVVFEEVIIINILTNMISVKRVGIEHKGKMNIKTKGVGTGFTTVRYDNIYHIANKVEYQYTTPTGNKQINWDFKGWWRGHWRAFYQKDANGNTRVDERGRNMVDYSRKGKNRKGDKESVAGYMWVKEHIKGDKAFAQIRERYVKHA